MADQGKYDEAKLNYERAVAIWKKALGAEHPQVALGLSNLGMLLTGKFIIDLVFLSDVFLSEVLSILPTCFVCSRCSPRQVRRGQAQPRACAGHL